MLTSELYVSLADLCNSRRPKKFQITSPIRSISYEYSKDKKTTTEALSQKIEGIQELNYRKQPINIIIQSTIEQYPKIQYLLHEWLEQWKTEQLKTDGGEQVGSNDDDDDWWEHKHSKMEQEHTA